jgi:hypothetical protein
MEEKQSTSSASVTDPLGTLDRSNFSSERSVSLTCIVVAVPKF